VWPFDHSLEPRFAGKAGSKVTDLEKVRCFVLCPTRPKEYFDDVFSAICTVCDQIREHYGAAFECTRAIDITSSGVIHPEIWQSIRTADVIVADLTGLNGNVLYELGVAAAWHKKERVVVLRERCPDDAPAAERRDDQWLFDIQPVRHIQYTRTHIGLLKLRNDLGHVLADIVASAPFDDIANEPIQLPITLTLTDGADSPMLFTPGMAHRRMMPGLCLEFGSMNNFLYSWLSVGNLRLRNVRIEAELAFARLGNPPKDQPWIGVMLRSQSFWANHGHLAYIRADGSVWVTLEKETGHDDERIGQVPGFEPEPNHFTKFDVSIDDSAWKVSVGPVSWEGPVTDLPHVFGDGRVLFEGYFVRIGLRNLTIQLT
jgi:hypothetical protein